MSSAESTSVVVASALYMVFLAVLCFYGVHRSYLVVLCRLLARKLRGLKAPIPPLTLDELRDSARLPYVTVQLPVFNEPAVAPRLLECVAHLEYPRDRLEIQILDDSTDETGDLLLPVVARLRRQGLDIAYLHRTDRRGYKAGALDAGLKLAKGELIAMFDADFLPERDFLRQAVPHFRDPKVAVVQGRWGHLNREENMLTRVGALMLDGHHMIENRIRAAAGWLFNFAGTCGMWRKDAIAASGGWQHDTLTEDLDLSYRAQLRGWKFIYREDIVVPGELPADILAFRAQQYRWARGTVQTRRKLLGRILRADLPLGARAEAFFHLTPHIAYLFTMGLSVLLVPIQLATRHLSFWTLVVLDLPLFMATTGSLTAFYALSQSHQGRRAWDGIRDLPALLIVGVGLTPLITRALFDGQRQMAGEFVRTPKKGFGDSQKTRAIATAHPLPWIEMVLCLIAACSIVTSLNFRHYFATPFAVMFTVGYGTMAYSLIKERFASTHAGAEPMPVAALVDGGFGALREEVVAETANGM
jgi:cellulose synthase/poly-beta-1,6-N-acetylglucosamine synthase-like glycosyltransferase